MAEYTVGNAYTWEGDYKRTWEETEEVDVEDEVLTKEARFRARELNRLRERLRKEGQELQRGMMRHYFIVIDVSYSMNDIDLRPTRLQLVCESLATFIAEFFDQNPIAQMGIIVTQNGTAKFVSELSGNPKSHIDILRNEVSNLVTSGAPSLQNSLILARHSLRNVPSHTSREVLIILGSLTSNDPGNIFETIKELKADEIICSVIGLSAALKICHTVSEATSGRYDVILHEQHLKEVLQAHLTPPPISTNADPALLPMGFPKHNINAKPSPCACHGKITSSGYHCPRCSCKYCDIPFECVTCGMTLVSSSHIARSYHHLFPVPAFQDYQKRNVEISQKSSNKRMSCLGCASKLDLKGGISQCKWCKNLFCMVCDLYIHETLHNCPGCSVMLSIGRRS